MPPCILWLLSLKQTRVIITTVINIVTHLPIFPLHFIPFQHWVGLEWSKITSYPIKATSSTNSNIALWMKVHVRVGRVLFHEAHYSLLPACRNLFRLTDTAFYSTLAAK